MRERMSPARPWEVASGLMMASVRSSLESGDMILLTFSLRRNPHSYEGFFASLRMTSTKSRSPAKASGARKARLGRDLVMRRKPDFVYREKRIVRVAFSRKMVTFAAKRVSARAREARIGDPGACATAELQRNIPRAVHRKHERAPDAAMSGAVRAPVDRSKRDSSLHHPSIRKAGACRGPRLRSE